ncbi:MAG: carph-isopro domain-containing protein [Salipiger marinus]|uniref:carph-isopro domain-containing protein n=1 Tax=Salipiger marinus TaxID=555512 RepID=UPI004059DAF9
MEHIAHIWPTMAELASDIGKPYSTVAAWKQRGRIPAEHDFALIKAAKDRGHELSFEVLARARVEKSSAQSCSNASSVQAAE